MAKYGRWQRTIVDAAGTVMPGASVEVRKESDGLIASIFSTRTGAGMLNPATADAEGFVSFHVAGGAYKITATSGAFSRIWRYEPIGTAGEYDASDLLFSYPLNWVASGKPAAAEALVPNIIPYAMYLPAAAPSAYATVRVAPNAERVISVVKNGVQFATVTFANGATSGVIAQAAQADLVAGDQVWPIMPNPADTVMSDFSLVMVARR